MVLNIDMKYQPTLLTQTGQTQIRSLGELELEKTGQILFQTVFSYLLLDCSLVLIVHSVSEVLRSEYFSELFPLSLYPSTAGSST